MDPSDPGKPWGWHPLVEVALHGSNGETVSTLGLLDSGADLTVLNSEFAKVLGIDLAVCEETKTVGISGEPQTTYRTELEVEVRHLDRVRIPVVFIESPSVTCLVGQEGFFDAYRIIFERDHKVFEIKPSTRK